MRILWYPYLGDDNQDSPVQNRLRKDLKKRYDLMLRVETFLKKVRTLAELSALEFSGEVEALGDGLFEMKIPKTASGGVVRLYFCYAEKQADTLILLEAELKHAKRPKQINNARHRRTEYRNQQRGT